MAIFNNAISLGLLMTQTGKVLLAGLVGFGLGVALMAALNQHDLAQWHKRAAVAETRVDELLVEAQEARLAAARWRQVADSLRGTRDTVLVTRWRTVLDTAYVDADSTLPACQAALRGLRGLCRLAVDSLGREIDKTRLESDAYRNSADSVTASADSLAAAVDSLQKLVRAVPAPERKWLGIFSKPKVTAGVGCASSGKQSACGLMAGVGFTF